jgi:hypothetical protein
MKALSLKILDETNLSMVEEKRYILTTILILDSGIGVGEEIEIVLAAETDEVTEDSIACFVGVVVCHVLLDEGLDGTALDDGAEFLFLQHFYRKPELFAIQEVWHLTLESKTRGILSSNGTIASEETFQSPRIFGKNLFELLIGNLLLRSYL